MQYLLNQVDPSDVLPRAAKILTLASIANRTRRKSLIARTTEEYGNLLRLYLESLSTETEYVSVENLYTAVLLGLYKVSLALNHH